MPISNDLNDLESQVKKSKISAASFLGKGSFASGQEIANIHKTIGNLAGHVRKTVIRVGTLEKIITNQSKKITSLKNISGLQGQQIRGTNIGAKLPGSSADNLNKNISTIADTVSSIAETLKAQRKTSDAARENERKRAEKEKRGLAESKLEKAFAGIINAAQKIIAPVKSIIDRILDFIKTVILGRIIYKLVGWLGDPKNASKVKSIIRFVKDWWPTLLGAYIIFGTSFGRFTTKIIGMVARFAVQIATKAIPGLIALARRNPATAALAVGTTTYLTNQALNPSTQENQERQGFSGGGHARPAYRRGSLRRFFGLYGGGFPGYVSGAKGVDKIPAMLSDGEFVMSRGAVQMYGADTLAAMNAAGGGTNRPKIMGGTAYAQGGGPMGRMPNPDPNYKDPVLDDRLNLMKSLERYARSQASSGGNSNLIKALNDLALALKGQRTSGSANNPSSGAGTFIRGLLNQGQGFVNQASDPRNYMGLLNQAMGFGQGLLNQGTRAYDYTKNKILPGLDKAKNKAIDSAYEGLFGGLQRAEEKKYVTPEQYAKLSESQRLDVLVKDPKNLSQTESALTLRNQKAYEDQAKFIRGLYDPTKDKGVVGNAKKMYQDMMNRGLIPSGQLPSQLDPLIGKLTGGKVKHASAASAAIAMTMKGLLGPLGKPFRVDGSSLLEYNKPLMDFAIKNKLMDKSGNYLVGKESWSKMLGDKAYQMVKDPKTGRMVRGEHLYDKMQRESMGSGAAAKIANFGLGQFNFRVGKDGKAIVNDTWDSNNTAGYYFDESKKALKRGDIYNALFKGFSGVLRVNQNTAFGLGNRGFANINPLGFDLKSRSTFKEALNQKPQQQAQLAKPKQVKTLPVKPPVRTTTVMQGQSAVTLYSKNDPRRKNSGPTTPKFSARPSSSSKHKILGITLPF